MALFFHTAMQLIKRCPESKDGYTFDIDGKELTGVIGFRPNRSCPGECFVVWACQSDEDAKEYTLDGAPAR